MTFSHDQIQEHLLGFLEGELRGEARAAFDAHLSGCETCRGEVRAIEQTRVLARQIVRAPLASPVASEVRARVLAAAAAARRQGTSAQVPPVPAEPTSPWPAWLARWFDRRNARWTFPTVATVAAMAAFLLVRETVFREANPSLSKAPVAQAPVSSVSPPAPATPSGRGATPTPSPSKGSSAEVPSEPKAKSAQPRLRYSQPADAVRPERARAEKPRTAQLGKAELDEPSRESSQASLGRDRRADEGDVPARTTRQAPKKSAYHHLSEPLDDLAPAASSPRAASSAGAEPRRSGVPIAAPRPAEDRAFTTPPPAEPASRGIVASTDEGNAYAAPSAPPSAAKSAEAESASGALAERENSPVAKKAKNGGAPAAARSAAAAPPSAPAPAPQDPAQPLVDRAEKLLVARRFSEAAEVYRELLRRFPIHAGVPTWRKRLATADAAAAGTDGGFAAPPPPR